MLEIRYETVPSPVGPLFLADSDAGPLAVLFADDHPEATHLRWLRTRYPDSALTSAPCPQISEKLARFFVGQDERVQMHAELAGSDFEREVWTEISRIPFGGTLSYGAIARSIGQPQASRAVGMATGRNPVAILIPCHRVVGSDGSMTGYGGGLPRKRWLLAHESGDLFLPEQM